MELEKQQLRQEIAAKEETETVLMVEFDRMRVRAIGP